MMDDWTVSNYQDPQYGETWVYKQNPRFPNIHFSFSVSHYNDSHVATDDRVSYYFGFTNTFNANHRQADEVILRNAWNDYYTI